MKVPGYSISIGTRVGETTPDELDSQKVEWLENLLSVPWMIEASSLMPQRKLANPVLVGTPNVLQLLKRCPLVPGVKVGGEETLEFEWACAIGLLVHDRGLEGKRKGYETSGLCTVRDTC